MAAAGETMRHGPALPLVACATLLPTGLVEQDERVM